MLGNIAKVDFPYNVTFFKKEKSQVTLQLQCGAGWQLRHSAIAKHQALEEELDPDAGNDALMQRSED